MTHMLKRVLELLAGGTPTASQFERIVRDCGIPAGEPEIVFLTGQKKVLGDLADFAYEDKHTRLATLDAAQDALDAAIEREEDLLEMQAREGDKG